MKMNKTFLLLSWVMISLLAYWFGWKQGMNQNFPETSSGLSQGIEDKQAVQGEEQASANKGSKSSSTDSRVEISEDPEMIQETSEIKTIKPPEYKDSFRERMDSSNPVVRLQAFTELLQNPTSENIATAREAYEKLPEGPARFSELRMLSFSWGQADPRAALEWTSNLDGFEQRIGSGSVLDSWARYDSDGAIAWANENFEGEENPYYVGIISGMSESDIGAATELMTSLPYGRTRGRAASILIEKTWQNGEAAAVQFAENLPQGSLQNYAFGEIGEKIAREDLGRAVQWVENMDESEIKVAVSEDVAERWAKKSPQEAAQWVSEMPEGEARSESMEEVVTQWARKDPTATAEWLNQFPSGELMDEPIQRFVREVVRKDPDIAMTWAEAIVDQERKERTITEVKRVAERVAQQQEAQANGEPQQNGNPRDAGPGRGPPGSRPR